MQNKPLRINKFYPSYPNLQNKESSSLFESIIARNNSSFTFIINKEPEYKNILVNCFIEYCIDINKKFYKYKFSILDWSSQNINGSIQKILNEIWGKQCNTKEEIFEELKNTLLQLWFKEKDSNENKEIELFSELNNNDLFHPIEKEKLDYKVPDPCQVEVLDLISNFYSDLSHKSSYFVLPTWYWKTAISLWAGLDYIKRKQPNDCKVLFLTHLSNVLIQMIDNYRYVTLEEKTSFTLWEETDKSYSWNIRIYAADNSIRKGIEGVNLNKLNLKPSSYQKQTNFHKITRKNLDGINLVIWLVPSMLPDIQNHYFFEPEDFDLIIVDEIHHVVNDSFRTLLEYFKYDRKIWMTATPDRTDWAEDEIPEIFENNLLISKDLADWINDNRLCPVNYIIKETIWTINLEDETIIDYKATARMLLIQSSEIEKLKTIIFCKSLKIAQNLSKTLPNCEFLWSTDPETWKQILNSKRNTIISDFKSGKINTIATVDIFNEGFDIDDCDFIIFLRPTISSRIWVQQLGRWLRKSKTDKNKRLLVHDYARYENIFKEESKESNQQNIKYLKYKKGILDRLSNKNLCPLNLIENIEIFSSYIDRYELKKEEDHKEKIRKIKEKELNLTQESIHKIINDFNYRFTSWKENLDYSIRGLKNLYKNSFILLQETTNETFDEIFEYKNLWKQSSYYYQDIETLKESNETKLISEILKEIDDKVEEKIKKNFIDNSNKIIEYIFQDYFDDWKKGCLLSICYGLSLWTKRINYIKKYLKSLSENQVLENKSKLISFIEILTTYFISDSIIKDFFINLLELLNTVNFDYKTFNEKIKIDTWLKIKRKI